MTRCQRILLSILLSLMMGGCLVDDSTSPENSSTDVGEAVVDTTVVAVGEDENEPFRRTLIGLSDDVLIPGYQALFNNAQELQSNIEAYCNAIGTDEETTELTTAQSAWKATMQDLQKTLALQIGPITDNSNRLGGRIYSWPDAVSTCTIDRQIMLGEAVDYTFDTAPRQTRGLDALEYLLFNDNLAHTCSSLIPETTDWNARTELDRKQARCNFATIIATDLTSNAAEVIADWNSGYADNFKNAGSANSDFANINSALNTVTDALFFLDKEVKDRKLGSLLGFSNNSGDTCSNNVCPELVESPWSGNALNNLAANLNGFRSAFTATTNGQTSSNINDFEQWQGFDYILAVRNFPDLSETILANTDRAIELIEQAKQTPLTDQLNALNASDAQYQACINAASNSSTTTAGLELCTAHGVIKSITDLLKNDFLILMTLSLPERVEGDSD